SRHRLSPRRSPSRSGRRPALNPHSWTGRGSDMIEIRVLASSSAGNAYLVSDGRTPLLIECGLPFRDLRQRLGFGVTSLAGCLLSHEHADHARAARDILRAGVDLYATWGTVNALELTGHRLRPIRAHERFRV